MSPERQRVVIAELHGYDGIFKDEDAVVCGFKMSEFERSINGVVSQPIPDYLNDLNAIHEAILKLPEDLHNEFHRQLYILTKPTPFDMWQHNWAFITAGPEVLCEALLRTIGKWEKST